MARAPETPSSHRSNIRGASDPNKDMRGPRPLGFDLRAILGRPCPLPV